MLRTRPAMSLGIGLALVACTDSPTNPVGTGRSVGPALAAAIPLSSGLTSLATGEVFAPGARIAAQQEDVLPTGGEAEGRADMRFDFQGLDVGEMYTLNAETKRAYPRAEGRVRGTATVTSGTTTQVIRVEARIDCLAILGQPASAAEPAGNNAFLSGPITKWTLNGEPVDIRGYHIFVRVLDVGNGDADDDRHDRGKRHDGAKDDDRDRHSASRRNGDSDHDGDTDPDDGRGNDLASQIYVNPLPNGCADLFMVPVMPRANVRVRPEERDRP